MAKYVDYLAAPEIVAYYEAKLEQQHQTQYLFPNLKQMGLKIAEIQGVAGLPQLLTPSAYDAEPTLRGRTEPSVAERDLIFFREGMQLGEKQRRDLMVYEQSENESLLDTMMEQVVKDRAELIAGAVARCEKTRIEVITTGKITLNENGIHKTYDYGIKNKGEVTVSWSTAATATPLQDLLTAVSAVKKVRLVNAIMNRKTFQDMLATDEVKSYMSAINARQLPLVSEADAKTAIEGVTGLNVVVNDEMYTDKAGAEHPFFPDDIVTLTPSGEIGKTVFAPTPEEWDYMIKGELPSPDIQIALHDNAICAVSEYRKHVPVQILTTVSMEMIPALTRADSIYILTTKA